MVWYKITMPLTDWVPNGKGQQLIQTFLDVLVTRGGKPQEAAMFSQKSDDRSEVSFYFSPQGFAIAKGLIESNGGVPCPAPIRKSVNLAAGDVRAFDLLWPSPHLSN